MSTILIPVSAGELIDKITILEIKALHLTGDGLLHVEKELRLLRQAMESAGLAIDATLMAELRSVNQALWQIEDAIRDQERQQTFGDTFIQLARSVYLQNDKRALIKRRINKACASELWEEKSYRPYGEAQGDAPSAEDRP